MSEAAISVLHLSGNDEDVLLKTRQQIADELHSGRDVILVLDEPVSRRAERLTLASLAFQNAEGRFAVVTRDAERFSQLPRVMAERLNLFATAEAAVQWLQPPTIDMKQTLLYFSLN